MGFIVNYKIVKQIGIDELSVYFAELLIKELNRKQNKINIALSGGSTPKKLFEYLTKNYNSTINWRRINFFWGDERCVPPDNFESNYKLAYDYLFSKINIPQENIFRIYGENNPEQEATRYSKIISKNIVLENGLPCFDIALQGLGDDGHTASIFPDRFDLLQSNEICAVTEHPATKQKRITITGKVINNAKKIVFLATGAGKCKVVNIIINKKEGYEKLPASHINAQNGELIWLLDKDASSMLDKQ